MEETDRATMGPARGRDGDGRTWSRIPFARWGMLVFVLVLGAMALFAAQQSAGGWGAWAGASGWLLLLLLVPCLLMPFMMGGGHRGTSERNDNNRR